MHELNNPLFAVLGLVEFLLRDAEPGTKAHSRLELIQATGLEMKEVARALLDFAREQPARIEPVALAETIDGVAQFFRLTAAAKGVEFAESIDPEPLLVLGRRNELRQLLLNLFLNAKRALPTGGTVTVELRRDGADAVLRIADDGPGVPPELGERAFDAFVTSHADTGALGLGLTVARLIARRHGGELELEPSSGGASFVARLPLVAGGRRVTRVLVIDDEPILLALMRETLEQAGYETVGASDAARALALLEDETICLVVSDIVMPRLTGIELLEKVQRERPSVPVLLVTGVDSHANLTGALAGGAAGLVAKPFSPAEFVDAVGRALERSTRAQRELRPAPLHARRSPVRSRTRSRPARRACTATASGSPRSPSASAPRSASAGRSSSRSGSARSSTTSARSGSPTRSCSSPPRSRPTSSRSMRTHPVIGDRMLAPLELLDDVRPIVRHHHERWDGGGYPDGLGGEEIPVAARIVAVSDAVEAMSADRPYRDALPPAEVCASSTPAAARSGIPPSSTRSSA